MVAGNIKLAWANETEIKNLPAEAADGPNKRWAHPLLRPVINGYSPWMALACSTTARTSGSERGGWPR